jgi:co-chaperonin GroES (HSP10)
MEKIKVQPVPGKLLVRPTDRTGRYIDMSITGGKCPQKGIVVRTPQPLGHKLRAKESIIISEAIEIKNGDYIYYDSEYKYTLVIEGEEFHLINQWDILAREA